jgi:ADP-ribose pyrophosphatase YjhB (NUDIX family)
MRSQSPEILPQASSTRADHASERPFFTGDGMIVLVTGEEETWSLPGGHPEPGETIEQAFVREVREEACAIVEHLVYPGAQQVDDPAASSGPTRYYHTRFWARVRLEPSSRPV